MLDVAAFAAFVAADTTNVLSTAKADEGPRKAEGAA